MSIEINIHQVLSEICPATYPSVAPPDETSLPRIIYRRMAGRDYPTYAGDGLGATWLRVRIDTWALDYPSARQLADQARAALYEAVTVGKVTDNPSDYDKDNQLYLASFNVEVWS